MCYYKGIWTIFLLLGLGLSAGHGCPSDCICKWKGGKQTVECVNRALRTFPPTIDPGTQVLDVSGNSFETLPPDHFMRSGLINVQKVYLAKCRLSHVNSRAFRGLSNLVELDLSSNLLREIPSSAFPDCGGLMRLLLSNNPIHHIQKRAFVPLQSLTSLEISHAGIEIIEHGAFEGLHSLEWLKLDGNHLRRLNGIGILPLGLKGVWLEDNPWSCDCHLLELRLWIGDRNVGNSVEPTCNSPDRLINATLRSIPVESYACLPQLSPTTMYQKIGEGKNVSLLCKVSSTPESSIEWLFNGQPLTNSSLNLLVETSNAYPSSPPLYPLPALSASPLSLPIEKKSELLILNATSDENGTFLCVARNPAGTAMANFTLRVLTRYDLESSLSTPEYSLISAIPIFVSSYPNLFIIALSTVAVILLVVVVLLISLLICKCSRICFHGRGSRRGRLRKDELGGDEGGSVSRGNGAKGDGDLGGKLSTERNLSESSTLTTKTNGGSVFLLSDLGDSNPDLIEGVKRVEGDGTAEEGINAPHHHPHHHHPQMNGYPPQPHHQILQYNTLGRNPRGVLLEPSQFYPLEYGLPSQVVGATATIRRSPSFPSGGMYTPYYHQGYGIPPPPPPHQQSYIIPTYTTYNNSSNTNTSNPNCNGGSGESYYSNEGVNCSCTPIIEEEGELEGGTTPTNTNPMNEAKAPNPTTGDENESLKNSPKIVKSSVARIQRQLTAVVNESPDEGYEDGGAEGTEI